MRGVGVGAHGLAEHVDLPVRGLALRDEGVERPGGAPHDVGAGLVVLRVLDGDAARADEAAHEALCQVVARAVVGAREVLLGDVVHDVEDARDHLVARQRVGELGVEHGEAREDAGVGEDVADLHLGPVVGDDRPAVHLRAGAHHREHRADGDDVEVDRRLVKVHPVLLPGIHVLGQVGRDGHGLGVVDARPAAHGQDEVHVVLARDARSLVELLDRGVGHDARVLHHVLARRGKRRHDLVVDPVPLDGPASVDELDVRAVGLELRREGIYGVLAKDELGWVVVGEVAEHVRSSRRKRVGRGGPRPGCPIGYVTSRNL